MNAIYLIVIFIYTYYFMQKVIKNTPVDCELTKSEKIQVIITLFLSTIISWIIYHFGWKDKLPTKAKQVNLYVRNMIVTSVIIGITGIIIIFILEAINPNRS